MLRQSSANFFTPVKAAIEFTNYQVGASAFIYSDNYFYSTPCESTTNGKKVGVISTHVPPIKHLAITQLEQEE